ncbi:MAG TPA: cellulase family glycosylhydrolase [Chitinophagaceae bacterium]|nr:cellulase family glycosylhydrolase [Chitinophagaceae bacterium]
MKKILQIALLMMLSVTFLHAMPAPTAPVSRSFGVTLCGAEFGQNNLPGILNTHYIYPTQNEVDYFANKGVQIIQLPIRWERIQRTLGGPLDAKELSLVEKFLDDCAARNIQVTLIMQNYGRYKINNVEYIIGSPQVSRANYKDVWRKLATALRNRKNIYAFSIMSEPNHMQNYSWFESAQQAINGIREVDRTHTILVDGDNYSGPETWVEYNDQLKYLVDPANNMMFNAHCYFDEDRSGEYKKSYAASGANEMTGVDRIKHFVDWLHANNKRGFVGEFGIPNNDNRWMVVLDNFLQYLTENNIGGCYWAAGRWWKNYPLSIEPIGSADKPQMNLYAKYLVQTNKSQFAKNTKKSNSDTYNYGYAANTKSYSTLK